MYRRTVRMDAAKIVHAFIKLSSRCNLMCAHCYETPNQNIRNEIGLAEYETFAKQLKSLLVLTVTGGEPFLNPDLVKIINLFDARNIMLTSNGFFPDRIRPMVEELLERDRSRRLVLAISLDGKRDIHNAIRRNKDSYDRAVETIKMLKAIWLISPKIK